MIPGVDVSAAQGYIDWQKVSDAGYRFAYLKCTEGNQGNGKFVDQQFHRNLEGARAAGVVVGCYHFAFPLPEDSKNVGRSPNEQVAYAYTQSGGLGSQPGDLAHALDLEWPAPQDWRKWGCSAEQIAAWAKEYCELATERFGRKPVIYLYPDFYRQLVNGGADVSWASEYDLWFADYGWPGAGTPPEGWAPPHFSWVSKTWTNWAVCQYSAENSAVQVPGIRVPHVDRNVIEDEATLARLQGF